jgi:hypothetical protein
MRDDLPRVGPERARGLTLHALPAEQVHAEIFLSTLQNYLKSLTADLKAYTITEVSGTAAERTRYGCYWHRKQGSLRGRVGPCTCMHSVPERLQSSRVISIVRRVLKVPTGFVAPSAAAVC